jgi:hypothetical protein
MDFIISIIEKEAGGDYSWRSLSAGALHGGPTAPASPFGTFILENYNSYQTNNVIKKLRALKSSGGFVVLSPMISGHHKKYDFILSAFCCICFKTSSSSRLVLFRVRVLHMLKFP